MSFAWWLSVRPFTPILLAPGDFSPGGLGVTFLSVGTEHVNIMQRDRRTERHSRSGYSMLFFKLPTL